MADTSLWETLKQDAIHGGRLARKSPAFTAAVVLSLALGIGANTAIFTLMDAVMWRALPVKDPEHLLVIERQVGPNSTTGFDYSRFKDLRANDRVADVAGFATATVNAVVDGGIEPALQGQLVSGRYFQVLGVGARIGRTIGPEDDQLPNGHPVVMLSYGYWQRRFALDPSILGKTVRISDLPFTVIGVTPPGFFGVELGIAPDVFLPIMMQPTVMSSFENLLDNPIVNRGWVQVVGRVQPGVTIAEAEGVLRSGMTPDPVPPGVKATPPKVVLSSPSATSRLGRQFSQPLMILMVMVGVVLLIACANTANMLLARSASRGSEFAMRLALGAGRGRLIRQLLVESTELAVLGGILGMAVAFWATRLLVVFMSSGQTPIYLDLSPNARVFAFTAAVSVFTGLLFGLAPAIRSTRMDLTPALKNLGRSTGDPFRSGKVLAIVQMVLSLQLLVSAGLFARSLQNLTGTSDVPRDSVIIVRVEPKGSDQRNIPGTTARLDRTYRNLLDTIRHIPGIRSASLAQSTPTGGANTAGTNVKFPSGENSRVPLLMVYSNYFSTMGIPIVAGRDFNESDMREDAPTVCLVSEAFALKVFPGENPIGKSCFTGRRPRVADVGQSRYGTETEAYEIIGVARDSRFTNPRGDPDPVIYTTFLQTGTGRGQMVLHARVSGHVETIIPRIRQEVAKLDPTLPLFEVHTLEQEMNAALVQQRLIALLSTLFAGLALTLACVGLYGLLAFAVIQRVREMGVRMALGAGRTSVLWLVMREALLLVAIGIAVGIPGAFGVARFASSRIAGLLYHLKPTDTLTIAGAAIVLVVVAATAAYLPARRASRVDPLIALRSE